MLTAAEIIVEQTPNWMPAIVSAIGAAGLVLAAVIPVMLTSKRKTIAKIQDTREQITNGHDEHLRVTLDRHQKETLSAINDMRKSVQDDIGGIRAELRGIRKHGMQQDERILELERTGPARV